ncbi:MAG TPA: pentapeptide repeat-containing protein [Allocoleopsis sp.]
MKASEVLRRYAKGERDFRRANLQGQAFREQDLTGADFSEADIRGTNFSHASLQGANFTGAKAGVQQRWLVVQQISEFITSTLSGTLSAFSGALSAALLFNSGFDKPAYLIAGVILGLLGVIFFTITHEGFTFLAFLKITSAGMVTVAFAFMFALVLKRDMGTGMVTGVFAFTLTFTVIVAFAVIATILGALKVTGMFEIAVAVVGAFAGTFVGAVIVTVTFVGFGTAIIVVAISVAVAVTVASLGLGIYCSHRALQGDGKFALLRTIGVAFGSIGGTSFCGADLAGANFSHAVLKSANFNHTKQKQTILTHVCWQDTQKLDRARVGDSILSNVAVRDLLVTRNGYKKSYVDAKLRGANLNGVNLNEANLKWADLSDATLHRADLRGADLTETLVLGTDFAGACLTGACLEAWNIDHTTNLEGVDCQYVYLLGNQQERRPSSGDFAPGEFTKLFQEVLSTVDLIFRNGVDWKAFVTAFRQVQVENGDTPLEVQSIENKGDGVVIVRVSVPPEANKEKIHAEFNQQYELAREALEAKYRAELQAKESEITVYREQSVNMWGVINSLANRPINVQAIAEAKAMNDSTDQSRNINVGGDLNLTGSTLNLGEISGTITNTINQLPDRTDPNQPNLKALLTELQGAIESEPNLPDPDKVEALEQVGTLAKAGQNPQDGTLKKLANTAVKVLKGTVASLPSAATLAEACTKLLPLIGKALGLPI